MTTTKRQKIVHLKISNLESNFWNSQFFWKMNEKRKILRGLRIFFFSVFLCFLEVFTIPEIAFEIYWPLEARAEILENISLVFWEQSLLSVIIISIEDTKRTFFKTNSPLVDSEQYPESKSMLWDPVAPVKMHSIIPLIWEIYSLLKFRFSEKSTKIWNYVLSIYIWYLEFIYSERPQNFAKSPPYFYRM